MTYVTYLAKNGRELDGILSQIKNCTMFIIGSIMVGEYVRKSILDYVINMTKKQT